jgi:hypothetical protein
VALRRAVFKKKKGVATISLGLSQPLSRDTAPLMFVHESFKPNPHSLKAITPKQQL